MDYNKITNQALNIFSKLQLKKFRYKFNLHIVEGKKNITELLKRNFLPDYLLIKENQDLNNPYFDFINKDKILVCSDKDFKKIADSKTPQNYIAVYKNQYYDKLDMAWKNINKIIILDKVQDPKNFGAIIRLAVAFNIDCIISFNHSSDIYNPKTVRAAAGLHLSIPVINIEDILFLIRLKKKYNFTVYSADINGNNIKNIKFNTTNKMIIFGNEGNGIENNLLNISDQLIKIKMDNNVESLNISTAAGIILYKMFS